MASTSQAHHPSYPDSCDHDEHDSRHCDKSPCGRYAPGNVFCNAPCPPGALCNTEKCDKRTEFYVQRWRCTWRKLDLKCCGPRGHKECAWTKAWSCSFDSVSRCEVLKRLCCRPPPRCPADCDECDCFVPEDAFFAKVWEIEYEPCPDHEVSPYEHGYSNEAHPVDCEGNPAGCACCGLNEILCPRWVKITCKSDIPASDPFAVPLPYYERPCKPPGCRRPPALCAGAGCRVGPSANRSPDFWLAPSLPFA